MSEEERAARIARDYAYSKEILILRQREDILRERLTQNQLRGRPRGRPAGARTVTRLELERVIDRLRVDDRKVTQAVVAREYPCGLTTLKDWLRVHPGAWAELQARGRSR